MHNAEEQLFGDYSTIGLLVTKLPATVQDRRDLQAAAQLIEGPVKKGEAFSKWLEDERRVPTQARLRSVACDRQEGPRRT